MAHKGLREFTGEEAGSLFLGQSGFHVLTTGETTAAECGVSYWVALKSVSSGGTVVKAQSAGPGEDFTVTGAYAGLGLTLPESDTVYGAFDSVCITGVGDYLIAYIGK